MSNEQIQEWFSHPVTQQFFKEVKEAATEIRKAPRFKPNVIGQTADMWGIFNAHAQGMIEGLDEILSIKDSMLEPEDES